MFTRSQASKEAPTPRRSPRLQQASYNWHQTHNPDADDPQPQLKRDKSLMYRRHDIKKSEIATKLATHMKHKSMQHSRDTRYQRFLIEHESSIRRFNTFLINVMLQLLIGIFVTLVIRRVVQTAHVKQERHCIDWLSIHANLTKAYAQSLDANHWQSPSG